MVGRGGTGTRCVPAASQHVTSSSSASQVTINSQQCATANRDERLGPLWPSKSRVSRTGLDAPGVSVCTPLMRSGDLLFDSGAIERSSHTGIASQVANVAR
jgi:hypothetical protein